MISSFRDEIRMEAKMEFRSDGFKIFFDLVIEVEESGQKVRRVVPYCRPDQVPLIGVSVIGVNPDVPEKFEVKDGLGPLHSIEKGRGFWKFLSTGEVTVTVLDEEWGKGYEFNALFQPNGDYTELHVSRSRLERSGKVTIEKLSQALIEAAETFKRRRTRPESKAIQDLIQQTRERHAVLSSAAVATTVHTNGRGKRRQVDGYFKEVYLEAKNNPVPLF